MSRAVLLLGAFALLAQDPAPAPSSPKAELEAALVAGVDDERARDTVRELVALGSRMGGTASGAKAAEYLAARFRALGLETRVVEDRETWAHQELSFRLVAHPGALDGEAEPPEPHELERVWPFGFSPSARGRAPLSLELVEDGARLIDGRPRRQRSGPAPAVVLTDGVTNRDGSWPMATHLRAGSENPYPVFALSKPEGARLRGWLEEGRPVELEYELEAVIEKAAPRTVIATLPAREGAPPGYFLFCAHGDSDSGGPGANDNASGEAVVLEIAASLAAAIRDGGAPAPPRELRFAVWGKEIHSTLDYYENRVPGEGVLLGVCNFDQAGFGSGAEQLNIEPDDLPANVSLVRALLGVLRDHAVQPGFPEHWATNKSLGGTDSYVFSRQEEMKAAGRPALTVFTSAWGSPDEHPRTEGMPGESWSERDLVRVDYDLHYHSAGDTPENTTDREPHNMGWCARVALLGAWRWLEAGAK